jgi:Integrase core domain.
MAVACDDATGYSCRKPIKTKSGLKEFAKDLLDKAEVHKRGTDVKRIRCDNAPETKNILPLLQYQMSLEMTTPHSPQFNVQGERCIAELWKGTKAILTGARLTYRSYLLRYRWKYVEDIRSPT